MLYGFLTACGMTEKTLATTQKMHLEQQRSITYAFFILQASLRGKEMKKPLGQRLFLEIRCENLLLEQHHFLCLHEATSLQTVEIDAA